MAVAPVRVVIFDFDGTLADTLAVGIDACNAIAPEFGLRAVSRAEVPGLMGMTTRDALRSLGVPMHLVPALVRRVRTQMRRRLPEVRLFDGIDAALADLHGAGIRLGVITSNSRANVELCLERHGVIAWFEFIHSSTHLFGKDRALARVLRRLAVPASHAVYVGDQDRDLEAARRCRIPVVAVGWGYQSAAQLDGLHPDHLATDPADLVRWLIGGARR